MKQLRDATKVLTIGHDLLVTQLFRDAGATISNCVSTNHIGHYTTEQLTSSIAGYDLVVFTGGPDIHTAMYTHDHYQGTLLNGSVGGIPERDLLERLIFQVCTAIGVPMVGICRGAQMLCALNGGWLVQDSTGHHEPHSVTDAASGREYRVTSDHHQMMVPSSSGYVLAYAEELSDYYHHSSAEAIQTPLERECEVVLWEGTLSLGHQPHPEWGLTNTNDGPVHTYCDYFIHTVNELLKLKEGISGQPQPQSW